MRTLYLECNMGISADMLLGALLELMPNKHVFLNQISSIGLPGVTAKWRSAERCGVWGSQVVVLVGGAKEGLPSYSSAPYISSPYLTYSDIVYLVTKLDLPKRTIEDVVYIYTIMASALAKTKRISLDEVHFYEEGSLTVITSIIGCCMLIGQLKVSKIVSSPIHIGHGTITDFSGEIPVPTPAVANILINIPTFGGSINGQLCTLSGAAIARHFVQQFSGMPIMQVEKIGCGIGEGYFQAANCLRAFLGSLAHRPDMERFFEVHCEIDSITGDYVMKNSI